MFGKNSISLMLATALVIGAVRLPAAAPCILSNAPVEKTCAMDCCKNISCCETSQQRTAPPVQPLARAGSDQQNILTLPTAPVAVFNYVEEPSFIFSSAARSAHSPPPLALICIRLI